MNEHPAHRYSDQKEVGRRWLARILSLAALLANTFYVGWVYLHLNSHIAWMSYPFAAAETGSLCIFGSFIILSWNRRSHRPGGVAASHFPEIDVFIPVCGESPQMVKETLDAARSIAYQHKEIYVLDDKGDPELRKVAEQERCHYFVRDTHEDAKAGNLNSALKRTHGDLVLVLDADQVPEPEILQRLVGYFQRPTIGFVQTRQNFKVPAGDPFCSQDPLFYEMTQPSNDGDNAAFSCGSGVLYRRQALEQIGGFSTWNIVEDLHTSMKLHGAGWRSVYQNQALTTGEAPSNLWEVYRQRERWATDALRMFFWDNPLKNKALTLRQKFHYSHIGLVYLFASFLLPILYLVPIISLFTDHYVLTTSPWHYAAVRLPGLLLTTVSFMLVIYPYRFYRETVTWFGYFPCYIVATFRALMHREKKPDCAVTSKEKPRGSMRNLLVHLMAITPQLLFIVGAVAAIVYGFTYSHASRDVVWFNALWALWVIERNAWVCLLPTPSGFHLRTTPREKAA